MGRVEDKVAFVSGAARGMGRAHAVGLAEEGAHIIMCDICEDVDTVNYALGTAEELAETARMVESKGRAAVAVKADVRDPQAIADVVQQGIDRLGRLDIVVANAGVCTMQGWDEVTDQLWKDTIDINLTGVWNTVRPTIQHLIDAGGGSIVMVSSISVKGQPFLTPYVTAKAGLVGLMRTLANELAQYSVRVNTIHPTGVDTPLAGIAPDMVRLIEGRPDLGPIFVNALPVEVMQPEEITKSVLYLASDDSRYVTGMELKIDAGCWIR